MNTFTGALRRTLQPVLLAVVLALTLAAASATTAGATAIKLRVETPNETLFSGAVNTGPRSVPTFSSNCSGKTGSVAIDKATAATAVADALDALGASAPAFATAYGGTYICQVGAYGENYPNGSWFLKINNLDSPPPVGYVTAGDELKEGDDVLVYYSGENPTSTLDLKLPGAAKPGAAANGSVDSWTNFSGDVKSAAAGATVSGGGVTATTAADGSFSLTFPSSGSFLITATKAGAVRDSALITVDPAAPLVRVNRFVKCNKTYAKGSKQHRRCVRIVRAKQAAAAKQG